MNNFFVAVAAISIGSWVSVPGGSWSPTQQQVTEVRNNLEPFIKQQASEQHLKLKSWPSYSFQYQGQIEGTQHIIFVNAFCIPPPQDVQQRFVMMFDGGPCFFQVKYDPYKKVFFQVFFNGAA